MMLILVLVLFLAKVVDLGMARSFYLTLILRTLAGLLKLLELSLHLGELVSSLG